MLGYFLVSNHQSLEANGNVTASPSAIALRWLHIAPNRGLDFPSRGILLPKLFQVSIFRHKVLLFPTSYALFHTHSVGLYFVNMFNAMKTLTWKSASMQHKADFARLDIQDLSLLQKGFISRMRSSSGTRCAHSLLHPCGESKRPCEATQ